LTDVKKQKTIQNHEYKICVVRNSPERLEQIREQGRISTKRSREKMKDKEGIYI
jgi:hypothetical protein